MAFCEVGQWPWRIVPSTQVPPLWQHAVSMLNVHVFTNMGLTSFSHLHAPLQSASNGHCSQQVETLIYPIFFSKEGGASTKQKVEIHTVQL
jgi:hypothetical protein